MNSEDILDYYKEKYNMKERGFHGFRYLAFDDQTPWIISDGINPYTVNVQEDLIWSWKEKNGRVVDLIWSCDRGGGGKIYTCNQEFIDPLMDKLYKKYIQFCYELKQVKYKNKLKDIEKDF